MGTTFMTSTAGTARKTGAPLRDNRVIVNALIRILRTGAPWRDLPSEYGPWQSVYTRFRRWEARGIWQRALEELAKDATDNESLMIDSTTVRAHQHAAGARGGRKNRRSADLGAGSPQKSTLL